MKLLGACGVDPVGAVLFEMLHEFFHGHGTVGVFVVVGAEHFQECPLGPAVELRVACAYFAVPVEAEADLIELAAVAGCVYAGCHLGVLTGLDGILLGRKSIGVVSHGVEHIESLQTFVAGHNIAGDVAQGMAYVESGARRVGEHVEHIVFGLGMVYLHVIYVAVFPVLSHLALYFFMIVFHCYVAVWL